MSEIDYSQFLYNRKVEEVKEMRTFPSKKPKRPKKFKPLIVLLVVVLCFAILFFSVDIFTNGFLVDKITASLRGNIYNYYFVVADRSNRELSYAQSLLVKQGGGSGYIFNNDGFKVVYSVLVDKNQANTVCAKNVETYVYTVSIVSKETKLFNAADILIRNLITSSLRLEKGEINESDVLVFINSGKADMLLLKEEYLKQNKEEYVNLVDFILESLGGINLTTNTRIGVISDLRYITSGLVVSMQALAENK